MKVDNYNPKAREALGKSNIDIGVSIFKGIILLFTVIPVSLILKSLIDNKIEALSLIKIGSQLTLGTYTVLLLFVFTSMWIGALFRDLGLKQIHEAEEQLNI